MGRLRLWLQVGCVVAAFTALWTNYDRFAAVEPEEYWAICDAHPAAPIGPLRCTAAADQRITLCELRELKAALASHDHSMCEQRIEWVAAHTWHPTDDLPIDSQDHLATLPTSLDSCDRPLEAALIAGRSREP